MSPRHGALRTIGRIAMATAKGHYYIIDRDEREVGGELVRVATLNTWTEAKAAWDKTEPSGDDQVPMFFARMSKMRDGSDSCDTLACK
jgi:hypothetical protein